MEKKRWQMYVGNLKCGLNEEAAIECCSELGVKPIECEVISKQGNNTSDKPVPVVVRLMVKYDDRDTVMETLFWPKGVKIRGWYLPRRRNFYLLYGMASKLRIATSNMQGSNNGLPCLLICYMTWTLLLPKNID